MLLANDCSKVYRQIWDIRIEENGQKSSSFMYCMQQNYPSVYIEIRYERKSNG